MLVNKKRLDRLANADRGYFNCETVGDLIETICALRQVLASTTDLYGCSCYDGYVCPAHQLLEKLG